MSGGTPQWLTEKESQVVTFVEESEGIENGALKGRNKVGSAEESDRRR